MRQVQVHITIAEAQRFISDFFYREGVSRPEAHRGSRGRRRGRLLLRGSLPGIELYEPFHDVGQLAVRDICHDHLTDLGLWPGSFTYVDVDRLDRFAVDSDLRALQADVGALMIAASGWASGPVDGNRPYAGKLLRQRLNDFQAPSSAKFLKTS